MHNLCHVRPGVPLSRGPDFAARAGPRAVGQATAFAWQTPRRRRRRSRRRRRGLPPGLSQRDVLYDLTFWRIRDNTAPRIGRVGARKKTGRQFESAIRNFISVPTPRLQQAGYSFPRPSVSGVAETGATENLHPRTGKHAQMENWIMTFVATSSALSETMSEANTHTIDQAGWSMTRENAQQETH
jgi:hypothetical protein